LHCQSIGNYACVWISIGTPDPFSVSIEHYANVFDDFFSDVVRSKIYLKLDATLSCFFIHIWLSSTQLNFLTEIQTH